MCTFASDVVRFYGFLYVLVQPKIYGNKQTNKFSQCMLMAESLFSHTVFSVFAHVDQYLVNKLFSAK